jgi:hypothetical protein
MSGLEKKIEIASWLSRMIYESFRSEEIQAWLIGSILDNSAKPEDCDILIMVHPNSVSKLAQLSPVWRENFGGRFNLPLHLTRLTYDEAETSTVFLDAVFSKPHMLIEPQHNNSFNPTAR